MEVSGEGAAAPQGRSRAPAEIAFAALLTGGALWLATLAWEYPAESATYPLIIAFGIAALGVFIGLREMLRLGKGQALAGSFAEHGPRLAIGIVALFAYFAAVSVIGFILPSLMLGVALPAAVGFRRPGLALTVAAVSVVAIIVVFVLGLGRPIPPDILSVFWGRLK